MTLACEDANSKLVEVLTVAHVDAEDHVGNSLLQILKLRFGHEVKFCSDFEHRVGQDFLLLLTFIIQHTTLVSSKLDIMFLRYL